MDPELLQQLKDYVDQARRLGVSDREINSDLRRGNYPVNSLSELETEYAYQQRQGAVGGRSGSTPADAGVPGQRAPVPQEEPAPLSYRLQSSVTPLIQGGTGGFASDVIKGLELVGLQPQGSAEDFRGQLSYQRQHHPLRSTALELGGFVAGPGKATAPLISRASGLGGKAGERLAAGAAARAGGGELARLTAGGAGRAVGAAIGGGTAAGGEGFAYGYGSAAGNPPAERAQTGALFAVPSTLLGGAFEGVRSSIGSARAIGRARHAGGEALADAATESGGLLGTHSVTRARGRLRDLSRQAYSEADPQLFHPDYLLRQADDGSQIVDPAIRRVLQNSGTDEATGLLTRLDDYASGQSVEPVTVAEVDKVRKQIKRQATAIERKIPDSSAQPDIFRVDEAKRALNLIDEGLSGIPEYTQGSRLFAKQSSLRRAEAVGKKFSGKSVPADAAEALLRGEEVHLPGAKKPVRLKSPAEQAAFREAFAEPLITRLRGGSGSVQGFLDDLFTGTELKRKVRLLIDDKKAYQQFLNEASQVRAIGEAGKLAEFGVKYAGFIGLGSSLAGGIGTTLLFD